MLHNFLVPVPHEGLEVDYVRAANDIRRQFPFPMRGWKTVYRLSRSGDRMFPFPMRGWKRAMAAISICADSGSRSP